GDWRKPTADWKHNWAECLRDIGLEQACLDVATPSHNMAHTRWCRSMAGEEFARVYSWGHDPTRKVRTAAAWRGAMLGRCDLHAGVTNYPGRLRVSQPVHARG